MTDRDILHILDKMRLRDGKDYSKVNLSQLGLLVGSGCIHRQKKTLKDTRHPQKISNHAITAKCPYRHISTELTRCTIHRCHSIRPPTDLPARSRVT